MKRFLTRTKSIIAISLVFVLALGSGCAKPKENKTDTQPKVQADMIDDNYRVFYQIFVGSFSDSDGDGTGDIRGIINRLDYLNDGNANSETSLGVQGIWLSPIFKSPSYHKYDASDYYQIDEKFGNEEDLKELIELCHERNVKVILDLAINHTSTQSSWFQSFTASHKSGNTGDYYYNFYSWAKASEQQAGATYAQIPGTTGEYYECNFDGGMPELNYDNEYVRDEVLRVAQYWLDLGVDGFRFDAVKYIYFTDMNRSVDFWDWYMSELKAYKEDIYCVGECWSGDSETLNYITALNCFNFQMAQGEGFIANAAKGLDVNIFTNYVEGYIGQVLAANPEGMMIPFIANHDMDRSSGYLTPATFRAHMAANLYLLCSGSPFIYYGEEIGLKGTRGGANTDANRRLAMLWGDGDTVRNPEGTTYDSKKQTNGTVADQLANESSLFHYYRKVLDIRNKYPEIARGEYNAVAFADASSASSYGNRKIGGFLINYGEEQTLLIHNVAAEEGTVDLNTCPELKGTKWKIADSIGQGSASLDGTNLTIGMQTSVILKPSN